MEKLNFFVYLINNPVTKKSLRSLTSYCEKCGKNRLDVALELFVGVRRNACIKCRFTEKTILPVLKNGAEGFNYSIEELKEKFRDPYWRRGLSSVIKGLSHFGVTRPFVPGAPFQVVWDVTYACNLMCKHCYSTAGKRIEDELTTEEAFQAIDKFDRFGVTSIAFSGGEPLVRKDFFDLTKYADEKGIYVAVATNGTLITEGMAEKMKKSGIKYVQISLDGLRDTHSSFRGIDGVFDRTVEGIKNCVKNGFFVNVSMVVTRYNYHEVNDVINLCEKLGVDWFMHYNFIPTGRGREILDKEITPEERENLLKMLYSRNRTSNISLLSTAPQFARVALQCEAEIIPTHFYNIEGERLKSLSEFIGGCGAGRFYIAMRANGDIQPCVFFPLRVGNIREDDLTDLWLNSKVFRELRNKGLIEGCGDCNYRYVCGGCRARAYSYYGDYLKPDPGCIKNKKYHEIYIKNNVDAFVDVGIET
ncbi:MAG TPA: radical SAM protein [Archaeoglobaceae archaeon]|nr:radical SAM protein [Archaeoglobaceae archaeon]